jgi:hypothetical protein
MAGGLEMCVLERMGDEEVLMGRRFGQVVDVFFWSGRGGEEKAPGHVQ